VDTADSAAALDLITPIVQPDHVKIANKCRSLFCTHGQERFLPDYDAIVAERACASELERMWKSSARPATRRAASHEHTRVSSSRRQASCRAFPGPSLRMEG